MAGFATDDPKLQLQIQAILDGKGFKDAEAGIVGLEGAAAAATPAIEGTEVAVMGLESALIPLTVGIAIILPMLIDWLKSTTDLTEGQKELAKAIDEQWKFLEPFTARLKGINEQLDHMAAAAKKEMLEKQIGSIEEADKLVMQLTERLDTLKKGLQFGGAPRFFNDEEIRKQTIALAEAKRQLELYQNAQREHLTLAEYEAKVTKAATDAIKEQSKVEGDNAADYQRDIDIRSKAADKKEKEDRKRAADFAKIQDKEASDLDKEARKEEEILKRKAIADKRLTDQERKNAEDRTRAHREEMADYGAFVGQSLGAMSSLFGKNKALAIAGAIADTYSSAEKALAIYGPTPIGYAAMAAAILTGLANVQSIKQADIGFDDPMSDMIASKLGRKSAADFVRLFGSGFHSGLVGMNGGGGTTNNTTINRGMSIQNMHMSGILAGTEKQMLVRLNRQLTTVAARHEQRTTLGR